MRGNPVIYNPRIVFYIIGILPIAAMFISIALYYGLGHNQIEHIPSIPEYVILLPESRVFSVAMNVVAWLSIVAFLVIDRYLVIKGHSDTVHQHRCCLVTRTVMNICAAIAFVSMIGFTSVTINENRTANIVFSCLLWCSLSVYYFMKDSLCQYAKLKVHPMDWACNGIIVVSMMISYILSFLDSSRVILLSVGSVFGYIGSAALFLKFILIVNTLPNVSLQLVKRP